VGEKCQTRSQLEDYFVHCFEDICIFDVESIQIIHTRRNFSGGSEGVFEMP
jgi:hypothetical protein